MYLERAKKGGRSVSIQRVTAPSWSRSRLLARPGGILTTAITAPSAAPSAATRDGFSGGTPAAPVDLSGGCDGAVAGAVACHGFAECAAIPVAGLAVQQLGTKVAMQQLLRRRRRCRPHPRLEAASAAAVAAASLAPPPSTAVAAAAYGRGGLIAPRDATASGFGGGTYQVCAGIKWRHLSAAARTR